MLGSEEWVLRSGVQGLGLRAVKGSSGLGFRDKGLALGGRQLLGSVYKNLASSPTRHLWPNESTR